MIAERLSTKSFRNLEDAEVPLGAGLTVVHGANGAGKTNLIEALYFALTGRSCRTRREREMISFGESLARAETKLAPEAGETSEPMQMMASISTTEGRGRRVDGRDADPNDDRRRPAVSVFMPDRLALVKGAPAARRAHLDRLAGALWPARAGYGPAYSRALAQRNALIGRIRRGGNRQQLEAWDRELVARAVPLVETRRLAADELSEPFAETAEALGLEGEAELRYRPATAALAEEEILSELGSRHDADIDRGYTLWGPHRDEVELHREGRALRRYGSQGQQRLALLALLFAEREALRRARRTLPLMLLDDVMSELDPSRRRRLVETIALGGQVLITATEPDQVPEAGALQLLAVAGGRVEVQG